MGLGADSLSVEEKGIFARDEFVSEVRKDDLNFLGAPVSII